MQKLQKIVNSSKQVNDEKQMKFKRVLILYVFKINFEYDNLNMYWSQNQSQQTHGQNKSLNLDAKISKFRSQIRMKEIDKERIKFMEKLKNIKKSADSQSQASSELSKLFKIYDDLETENFDCSLILDHLDYLLSMLKNNGKISHEKSFIIQQCFNEINLAMVGMYDKDQQFQINISIRFRDILKSLNIQGNHTRIIPHILQYLQMLSHVSHFSGIENEIFTSILQFVLTSEFCVKDYAKCFILCNIFLSQLEESPNIQQQIHDQSGDFNLDLLRKFIIKSSFELFNCQQDSEPNFFVEIYSETLRKYFREVEKIQTFFLSDQEPYLNSTIKDCLIELIRRSMSEKFDQKSQLHFNILGCLNFFISNNAEFHIKQMIEVSNLQNYLIGCALFQECQDVRKFASSMIEQMNNKFAINVDKYSFLELKQLFQKNL